MPAAAPRTVVLVGFMGAGKSTVGPLLATRMSRGFVDTDVAIERATGRSVAQLFARDGEAAFRELEHHSVIEQLAGPPAVVALGGGAVEDARTRDALRAADVVLLEVGFAVAAGRTAGDAARPMLARPGLEALYAARLAGYRSVASVRVDTEGRTPAEVAELVESALAARTR